MEGLCIPNELVSIFGDSIDYNHHKRVTRLVERLAIFENYTEMFDSVDVGDSDNIIDPNRYVISKELHSLIKNGYKEPRDRTITKDKSGVYLVVFSNARIKGEDVLVYNYIRYPSIFQMTLYYYILQESLNFLRRSTLPLLKALHQCRLRSRDDWTIYIK